MKYFVRALLISFLFSITFSHSYAALAEVSCSTSGDFTANSCDQCFDGGDVALGDNKGQLTDIWQNNSTGQQVLFKEEQEMPKMMPLNGASWVEVKASDSVDFWMFTEGLNALYNDETLGYTLDAGANVTWIESTLGSAYRLDASAAAGESVGMLVYDIAVHNVESDGNVDIEVQNHRECVLYNSAAAGDTPVPQTPSLPETGAEHILLALVALLLGFGFLKFRKK